MSTSEQLVIEDGQEVVGPYSKDENNVLDYTKLKPNIPYLVNLTLTCGLSSMQLGAALSASGEIGPVLKYQLDWPKDKVNTYQTLISTASVLGISIGAVIGGQIIAHGRRRAVIIFNIAGIIGSLLSVIPHLAIISIGRFIYGFSSGVLVTATPKIIEETIPSHYMDYGYGTSTGLAINLFVMISLLGGLLLPPETDVTALSNTQSWRILYLIPIPLMGLALFLTFFVHKYDSVQYHVE
jgi:MFS family permease